MRLDFHIALKWISENQPSKHECVSKYGHLFYDLVDSEYLTISPPREVEVTSLSGIKQNITVHEVTLTIYGIIAMRKNLDLDYKLLND